MASEYPTCSTCPFWALEDDDMEIVPVGHPDRDGWEGEAECHRNPPVGRMEEHGGPLFVRPRGHSYAWPTTAAADFCGEHPDFPAFLAGRADAEEDRGDG
jgi:hypothetical protein